VPSPSIWILNALTYSLPLARKKGASPVPITDKQVRMLMEEISKQNNIGLAAVKAGMSRNKTCKYLREGKLPSQLRKPIPGGPAPIPLLTSGRI